MSNSERLRPRGSNGPVHIRRNVESFADPYIEEEQLPENTVCKLCGDIYMSGRWYNPAQLPSKPGHGPSGEQHAGTCPACRKIQGRLPGGVLKLSGGFIEEHKDEILNLIRNETSKAQNVNPLERLMSMDHVGDTIEITTTNEKLAQRIGRALHKAYSGDVEYKWSENNKLARVNWRREA